MELQREGDLADNFTCDPTCRHLIANCKALPGALTR
jgi:hypothetical protein